MAGPLGVAFAKQGVIRRLRAVLPYVQRISAVFLIIAGVYITWFWANDLTSDAGEQGAATGFVDGASASATNWIGNHSGSLGLLLGGLVAIAAMSTVLKRFEPPEEPPEEPSEEPSESSPGAAVLGQARPDLEPSPV